MKNKLLIILLSFVLFCVPTFASEFDFVTDYLNTKYPGKDYIVKYTTSENELVFPFRVYVVSDKNFVFTRKTFYYDAELSFKSKTDVYAGIKWNYNITPSDLRSLNNGLYFSNPTTHASALKYFGDSYSDVLCDITELPIYSSSSGDTVPPLITPPLVSSVEDLTGIIISDVRTLIPMASLVLCLMLSVALLPRLLRRLMG